MIEVQDSPKGLSCRAVHAIPKDMVFMAVQGSIHPNPSMHSVQIDEDRHLLASGCFIYINHSFFPNCMLDIDEDGGEEPTIRVISLRDIYPGEEISFNYHTTEWELACPFVDLETGRPVDGLKHAGEPEKMAVAPYLSTWLKAKLNSCLVPATVSISQRVRDG